MRRRRRSRRRAVHGASHLAPGRTPARSPPPRHGPYKARSAAKGFRGDRNVAGEAAGPLGGVRDLSQRPLALLLQPTGRPPVQSRQHALTRQHRHRHDLLPLGRHHRQRRPRAPQRDPRVQMQIVPGEPDHRRDQPGQPRPAGIGGVVIDIASDGSQQRVRTGRVITPALTRQIRRQLHKARALARAAMLAPRQNRDQLGRISPGTRHGTPGRIGRPGMTSLRALRRARHHRAPAALPSASSPGPTRSWLLAWQAAQEVDQAGEVHLLVVVHGQVAAVRAVAGSAPAAAGRPSSPCGRVHRVVPRTDDQRRHVDRGQLRGPVPVGQVASALMPSSLGPCMDT